MLLSSIFDNVKIIEKIIMGNVIKKQNFFYILLFLIFTSFISIFTLKNNVTENLNCEQYLVSFQENLSLNQYLEKNPLSVRNNVAYIELNLFPDIKSFQCLGKSLDYNLIGNNLNKIIATSHKLLQLFNLLNVSVIYLLFLFFSKNSKFIFLFMTSIGYCISTNLFFGNFIFNYYFLIYPLTIIFYFLSSSKNKADFKTLDFFIFINVLLLIFNYDFYTLILPFVIIFYYFFLNKNLASHHYKILSFGAIFYYFLRQLSGPLIELSYIWQNLSSSMFRGTPRFADMYYTFAVIDCNKTGCDTKNNYGPLWEYLAVDLNITLASYITSILLILITQLFFFKLLINPKSKSMLIYFVYIAPPTSFLLERMNFDIVVIIFGYFALKKYTEDKKIISLVILTILTLVKIYPIAFLIGIFIYEFTFKSKLISLKIFLLIIGNSLIYFFYFILDLQTGEIANPTGISWTFGILTDISNYRQIFGSMGNLFYLISFMICILIFLMCLKNNSSKRIFSSDDSLLEISFFLCFLCISLYYNFDFRISVFSMGLVLIIKNYDIRNFELTSLLFLSTSVSNFYTVDLLITNPLNFYFLSMLLIVNQITFNLVFIFLTYEIFYFLKEKKVLYLLKEFKKGE